MSPEKKSSSVMGVLAALGVAVMCCLGVAVLAVPNFLKFGARSKEFECKANLKALFVAQKAHFADEDTFATDAETLGFVPESTRYSYLIAPGQVVPSNIRGGDPRGLVEATPGTIRQSLGVHGKCPDCFVTMACTGNIDGDPGVDVWTISTRARVIQGEDVPAGEPHHDVDDLKD